MCFEERNLAKNLQKNGNFSAKFKFESVTFKMFKETLLLILSLAVISKTSQPAMVVFALMISVAVIITHQKNIERLLSKKESRVNIFNKKSKVDDGHPS